MNIGDILKELKEYKPALFLGSEHYEVDTLVEDYQSVYEPYGIHVLGSLETKGSTCAATIITCDEFLGCLPATAVNVILVNILDLEDIYLKLSKILP